MMRWNRAAIAAIGSCVAHGSLFFLLYEHPPAFLMRAHKEKTEASLQEGWLLGKEAIEKTHNLDEIFNQVVFLPPISEENLFTFPMWAGLPKEEIKDADLFSLIDQREYGVSFQDVVHIPYALDLSAHIDVDTVHVECLHIPSVPEYAPELHISTNQMLHYVEDVSLGDIGSAFVESSAFSIESGCSPKPIVFAPIGKVFTSHQYEAIWDAPEPLQHVRAEVPSKLPQLSRYDLVVHAEDPFCETPGIDVQVHVGSNPYGEGFAFALTLTPQFDMSHHHMERTLHFFIDRSSNVDKYQFNTFKKAALKAIKSLQENDKFNIYVVSKTTEVLHPHPLVFSRDNVRKAEDFLDKQQPPPLIGKANVYAECARQLEPMLIQGNMHLAVVFPGSKATVHDRGQELYDLYEASSGKFSLLIGALGERNDLDSLALFARSCGGDLVHAVTYTSFARCVAKKVYETKDPVLVEASVLAPSAHIFSAYPKILYNRTPYTVTGTIDKLIDLDVHIEGYRSQNKICMTRRIALSKQSCQGDSRLDKALFMQGAVLWYTLFLQEGDKSALQRAQTLYKKS